ncbi:MAG: hypothetical protein HZA78_07150 [Candidatus Schekmanbacteria bacterium]|nr:hypothetical protein [Candidatus Schekmanbacteria bacterium]
MEPIKKDFSPNQLKDLLWEIDRAPEDVATATLPKEKSINFAQCLGDELEEIVNISDDFNIQETAGGAPAIKESGLGLDSWLREMALQKIDDLIKKQNLEKTVSQMLQQILPTIAENLISKEIEKIRKQIENL